jgi:alkyl sulfatase BDS1-like metallo-beta-lactamase superfamily hydrolase
MHAKSSHVTLLFSSLVFLPGNKAPNPDLAVKPASPATIAMQKEAAAALPPEDGLDLDFASRGFLATRNDPIIRSSSGSVVWDLSAFDYVNGTAPDAVHPALWRQTSLLRRHGLFAVSENIWQVRGFDVSNMTVIRGKTGWILVDPLNTRETAAAALALVNATLGPRPVSAVIYSHSHSDHFGGVRGMVEEADVAARKIRIFAPDHFTEESASENVMAAPATGRRGVFQFGIGLKPGPQGQMGSGLSTSIAAGHITLIAPTDFITRTGETRVVDGVPIEFQIVSGSEAPAEMNMYIAAQKVLLSAEMSTCSLHNLLTPRGAKVRDAKVWSAYLDEALQLYGNRTDTLISSHCWPRFGKDNVATLLAQQRDNYRYLHDQTVRLMNMGETPTEIAEELQQPRKLSAQWFNHGYYGTFRHNAKAVYQYYLGWYDAVPANLNPWPPAERAKRAIAAMGGSKMVVKFAQKSMQAGDYRWSSDLLNQLVFAEPRNMSARALLADSYEQQGYQAESGIWRNQFLTAANELRNGHSKTTLTQNQDMLSAVPTQLLLDSVATRFDPARARRPGARFNLVMADRNETLSVELTGTVMIARAAPFSTPDATLTAPRRVMLDMVLSKIPLVDLEQRGLAIAGDRAAVADWLNALDAPAGDFNIAEP